MAYFSINSAEAGLWSDSLTALVLIVFVHLYNVDKISGFMELFFFFIDLVYNCKYIIHLTLSALQAKQMPMQTA